MHESTGPAHFKATGPIKAGSKATGQDLKQLGLLRQDLKQPPLRSKLGAGEAKKMVFIKADMDIKDADDEKEVDGTLL